MYILIKKYIQRKYKTFKSISQSILIKMKFLKSNKSDIENQIEMIDKAEEFNINNKSLLFKVDNKLNENKLKQRKIYSIDYYKIYSYNSNKIVYKKVKNLPNFVKNVLFKSKFFAFNKNSKYYRNFEKSYNNKFVYFVPFTNQCLNDHKSRDYNLSNPQIINITSSIKSDKYSNITDSSQSRIEEDDILLDNIFKKYNDKLNDLRKK